MAWQGDFKEHDKLLHWVAHRVHRRCQAAGGRTIQLTDIYGELCVAFCVARDNWEPEHQVPFGAYLMRGMSNHINRWVDRELRQSNMAPFELDAEVGDENDRTRHDIIGDDSQSAEDALIEKDLGEFIDDPMRWRSSLRNKPLTPNARKFLELLASPPPSLMRILHGLQARAEYGRNNLNLPSTMAPRRITAAFIFDFMGINERKERASVYQQLEHLGRRVSQQ